MLFFLCFCVCVIVRAVVNHFVESSRIKAVLVSNLLSSTGLSLCSDRLIGPMKN